ncbi:hypothetical protein Cch01nite_28340 [Cellulomonas chitinilytica]|uniref:Uncharacterized protein n=1 Tax=Cellulomonas chitinilytica TaxID=398759 RepID=A0A919P4J1_9CELL|nr:hypothetical protein [Cellulomonas chitinilytica]GIG22110.1 hypothetical protein Cch01nite_28340 [Cellulomonas chitinilytica]
MGTLRARTGDLGRHGRHAAAGPSRAPHGPTSSARPGGLATLQRTAGNAAVSALLRERGPHVQRASLVQDLHGLLGLPEHGRRTVQRDLKADLRAMIGIYGPPHYEGILSTIRAASVAERQAAVVDTGVLDLIHDRFSGVWATSIVSSLLEGSQTWDNPPATAFYKHFVVDSKSGRVPGTATMNCWESIMYAAHLAGVLSAAWIRNYYVSAGALPTTTVDPTPALWAQLGWSSSLPTYDPTAGRVPQVGDLVFYKRSTGAVPAHVAVYMGGGECMSLWTEPHGVNTVQRIGIRDVAGTIHFTRPPW